MTHQPQPARLLVVDDDPLVRAGLRLILGAARDLDIVGEAENGLVAEELVARLRPDLVLMDIRMPVRDGIATTAALRARRDAPPVLVLTTFDTDDSVLAALRAGASGFLLKDTPPAQIVDACRRAIAGEPMLSPTALSRVIRVATAPATASSRRREDAVRRLATLTDRERQIAHAVSRGLSNADIGAELYLSVATVKAHLTRILEKLDAGNRVQVAITVHDAMP